MNSAKLYVGNLSYETSEASIRTAFEAHGEVASVNLITDRDSGRPKGFGFVEMGIGRRSSEGQRRPRRHPARRPGPQGRRGQGAGAPRSSLGGGYGGGGGGYGGGGGRSGGGRWRRRRQSLVAAASQSRF